MALLLNRRPLIYLFCHIYDMSFIHAAAAVHIELIKCVKNMCVRRIYIYIYHMWNMWYVTIMSVNSNIIFCWSLWYVYTLYNVTMPDSNCVVLEQKNELIDTILKMSFKMTWILEISLFVCVFFLSQLFDEVTHDLWFLWSGIRFKCLLISIQDALNCNMRL